MPTPEIFLTSKCSMCGSRKWCGRQCAHAPRPQPKDFLKPPAPPGYAQPAPPAEPPDELVQEEGTLTGFTITETTAAPKVRIGVRIDNDVLEALKATGPGWQTRINQILRAAVLPG